MSRIAITAFSGWNDAGEAASGAVEHLRLDAHFGQKGQVALLAGQRALVVVGASHKPYLDAYLNQMHDVRIVDIQPMLR